MAKLADAADLKSAGPKGLWGFKSPSGHQATVVWATLMWAGVIQLFLEVTAVNDAAI
jgi:hypothetical protein